MASRLLLVVAMETVVTPRVENRRPRISAASSTASSHWALEHFARLIWHRKVLVLSVFAAVSLVTAIVTSRLPNTYTSETLILVDPQKVPEAYIRSTVTGDVRNRLGTLSQQILSATRLQRIIETSNLYPEERKTMAREDVIAHMRRDIRVNMLSDYGPNAELQAFRITYSGRDPKLVAKVANELASLFIDENLKAREQQAAGTTEFLENQLGDTRKALEAQEARLRDFKLRHIGSMPQQETASLQILGQLQSQLQLVSEAQARAEQQKSYLQSMIAAAPPPVVDLDGEEPSRPPVAPARQQAAAVAAQTTLDRLRDRLRALQLRYSDQHPDIKKLKRQIEEEEINQAANPQPVAIVDAAPQPATETPVAAETPRRRANRTPAPYANPVLESQLRSVDGEIEKNKRERERINQMIASYQTKLASIPVNEQQITALERDYEISKGHYKELLAKQLAAETATQLEVRQKGEKFAVLDPAQPAGRPSRPNRLMINLIGAAAGLLLGLTFALVTEAMGFSITAPEQITAATGLAVLEVIPIIETHADRDRKRRRAILGAGFAFLLTCLVACGFVLYSYHVLGK